MDCCIGPEFIFNMDRAIRRLPLPSSQLGVTSSAFCLWTNWTRCFRLDLHCPRLATAPPLRCFPMLLRGGGQRRLVLTCYSRLITTAPESLPGKWEGIWAPCSRCSTGFSRTPADKLTHMPLPMSSFVCPTLIVGLAAVC